MKLSATVLGPVQMLADDAVVDIGGSRQRRILAALLVQRGSASSMDRLIEATFDGQPPDGAWRTFRTYIARLRRALDASGVHGSDVIVTVPSGYAISADLEVDADRFESLLRSARRELDTGEPTVALSMIEEALGLWSGSAYGEFADEEWARPDALRLEELRLVARECHGAALVESGRHDETIAEVKGLASEEPLREEPRRLLMLALYRSGRHAEALRAGREFRRSLAEETGLDWSQSLAELEQMILDRDPRLDAATRGKQLRGYVLGEVLTETPHGVTHRATQPSIGRDVAITVIPEHLANDPAFVRRFERHAQQIAAIEHPNVVPLYDYWREPGGAYLVHRFVVGWTLAARLENPADITPDVAADIIADVGAALVAASEHGVHHGRLTGDTVLLDEAQHAHLWGFSAEEFDDGLARDIIAYAALAEQLWARVATTADSLVTVGDRRNSAVREITGSAMARGTDAFASIDELRTALVAAANGSTTTSEGRALRRGIEGPNPYRGLQAFRETDARVFFGRRAMVDQLAADLRRDGIVVIIGPSGAGKSSVARAGLVPTVRGAETYVATMVPGSHPVAELEVSLSRVATVRVPELAPLLERPGELTNLVTDLLPDPESRLVLVIDQLEEAMTMSDSGERDLVFASLARTVRDLPGRVQLVLTARADFLGQILEHQVIGPLVRDHSRLITPLGSDELYEAIVEPAAAAGVAVEPELATALVADAIDAPGSLPLLQFALTELYEHRVDGTMTLEAYRRMGGLAAPIAQRAEEVYSSLSADEQAATRRLFSRLVTVGDGIGDARRRVLRSELTTVPETVLDAFGVARLLTFDHDPRTREPTVEIAHEAMIRRWPRLRSWVDDDRSGLLTLRHLADTATAWDDAGRDPAELYRGSRLATADDWAGSHDDELTAVERAFLNASRQARDDAIERERRRARRLRASAVAFAIVAVVAVIAGVVALVQRNRAEANAAEADARTIEANEQRDLARENQQEAEARTIEANEQRALAEANATEAERQRIIGDVQRLTAESTATLDEDPDLSIRLALEAYERSDSIGVEPTGQLIAAMQTAVQSSRLLLASTQIESPGAISPNGAIIAARSTDDGGRLVVIDAASGDEIRRVDTGGTIESVGFDETGDRIALLIGSPRGGSIRLLDGRSFDTILEIDAPHGLASAEFASRGELFATQRYEDDGLNITPSVLVWNLSRPDDPPLEHERVELAGWMPDGRTIAVSGSAGLLRFVDATTGVEHQPAMAVELGWSGDLSPDGEYLAVVRDEIEVWEVGGAEPVARIENINSTVGTAVRFTPDSTRIVQFGADDEIRVTTIRSGASISLFGNGGLVEHITLSADGARLLAPGESGVALWDLSDAGPAELGNLSTDGAISGFRFSADGSTAIVSEAHETGSRLHMFDLASASEIGTTGVVVGTYPGVASDEGLVAMSAWSDDVPGRVERLDGTAVTPLEPCDGVTAIDDRGRWLLVSPKGLGEQGCPMRPSRVIDPTTGAVIVDFTDRLLDAGMFGPSGTIAEDLLVSRSFFQDEDGGVRAALEVRRMPANELLGSWRGDTTGFWRPTFSADGRYVTVGSGGTGAYAISIELLLEGATLEEANVLRAEGIGGVATFPDAGGGWLVFGQSGDVLRFYDLETGREEMTFPVDSGRSTVFRITADGRTLYYADGRGTLRRFPLQHEALAALARERVQRDFSQQECQRFEISDDCSTFTGA